MSHYDEYAGSVPLRGMAVESRATFITKTYMHLAGAMALFVAVEAAIFKAGLAKPMFEAMTQAWWLVLGGFVLVSWMARGVAHRAESLGAQYAALGGFVVMEAIIFVPLLYKANIISERSGGGLIESAAAVTLLGFGALTAIAFITKKDFSFMRSFLMWAGFGAMALIVGGMIFGFNLGLYFSVGMVILAGASILYDTSNVIHHYSEDKYVAAALELFASVALMLWYVLRIFMSRR